MYSLIVPQTVDSGQIARVAGFADPDATVVIGRLCSEAGEDLP